ncbi:DUF4376 domain-containing protein [uncultured Desulfovibrio sp.]|uniref:DUF4376 domain-containing protein n=1 Tax=uncultured Desulfovibrio sp. TaxID=167968 RepID=UPI00262E2F60|nr:DUF4376 domain-containing protein [uncultured Desulfovibrio sp.]
MRYFCKVDDSCCVVVVLPVPGGFALDTILPAGEASRYQPCPEYVRVGWKQDGEQWREPENSPLEPEAHSVKDAKAVARERIAARRYKAEIGGIVAGGMPIPTDRDSQALITGATTGSLIDPAQIVRWKTGAVGADGGPVFVQLDTAAIQSMALAVRAHVQKCFDVESEKCTAIAALDSARAVAAWLDDNLDTGWPGADAETREG